MSDKWICSLFFKKGRKNLSLIDEDHKEIKIKKNGDKTYSLLLNKKKYFDFQEEKYYFQLFESSLLHLEDNISQIFLGTISSRIFNPINSNQNSRIHILDLPNSSEVIFNLNWNNGDLDMFIYPNYSIFNNLNMNFLAQENRYLAEKNDNSSFLLINREKLFYPSKFIVQIVNKESSFSVNYNLTVTFNELVNNISNNSYIGFWKSLNKGINVNFKIESANDGTLFYKLYSGNNVNGYQLANIAIPLKKAGAYYLEKTEIGYRRKNKIFFLKDDDNLTISSEKYTLTFSREENPKIVEYLNSEFLFLPISLFENWFTDNFLFSNTSFVPEADSNDFPGISKMISYKNEILNTGKIETFEGIDIWPEMISFEGDYESKSIKVFSTLHLVNINVFTFNENEKNYLSLNIENHSFKQFMMIELFFGHGNLEKGFANEWINGLFSIVEVKENILILTPLANCYNYPTTNYICAELKIVPRCFEVIFYNLPSLTSYLENSEETSLIKLYNFSSLNSEIINNRHIVYYIHREYERKFIYLILPSGIEFSLTEEIEDEGKISICVFPYSPYYSLSFNIDTLTLFPTPLTYFFTNKPTLTNSYSKIEITGLKNEYSILNGIHDASFFSDRLYNIKNNLLIYNENCYFPDRKYFTGVAVKSDGLPSYNKEIHGTFILRRIVSRLTNNSNYGDFADACCYLFKKQGVNTHTTLTLYYDLYEGSRNPTWNSIQHYISNLNKKTKTFTNRGIDPIGGMDRYQGNPSINYFMINELNRNCFNLPGDPIDFSLRFDPSRPEIRNLKNQVDKYLDYQVFNLFLEEEQYVSRNICSTDIILKLNKVKYNLNSLLEDIPTITGKLVLANPPFANIPLENEEECLNNIVLVVGNNIENVMNIGAAAIIIINDSPIEFVYQLTEKAGNSLTNYNGGDRNNFNSYSIPSISVTISKDVNKGKIVGNKNFRYGLIDKKFTDNKNVGYIFLTKLKEHNFIDLWVSILTTSFLINGEEVLFSSLNSIIFDNSLNKEENLYSILVLSSFFGDNRLTPKYEIPLNNGEIESNNFPTEIPCEYYQSMYESATFTGNSIVILTSMSANDGGDIFPLFFENLTNTGKISRKLVGVIDGRFQGKKSNLFSNIITKDSVFSIAPSINSFTLPIFSFKFTGQSIGWLSKRNEYTTYCSQRQKIDDKPLDCWNENEAGLYQSWGFSKIYYRNISKYERFNKIFGLPIPYMEETYHYPLLEDGILAALEN